MWQHLWLLVSLFIMTLGVAVCVKSELGSSVISTLPYVFETAGKRGLGVPSLTIGQYTYIMNAILVAGQIAVLRRRFNGPRQIFNLLLLVSALLVFTDWFNGYTGYSLDLVVPILCCAALVCNFIFAFLRSRFTANALVYLLMNIGIGVLPYILLFFRIDYSGRLDAHSLPWVICLIISVITFLGLVIFRGRALKNEIVKRLHM